MSIKDAKKALILGHLSSGMGERTLTLKYQRGLIQAGIPMLPTIDIVEWMGEDYEKFARLNYALADGGHDLFQQASCDLRLGAADLLLLLSWNFSLAAFFATGLHWNRRTVAALHVHHPNERVLTKLYQPADLLITGSPLAHERALHYGIPLEKLLLIPHVYPAECSQKKGNREYVKKLAAQQKKNVDAHARIVGCVGRLEYGKNFEFAVEAVRRLIEEGENLVLVLKGDFPQCTSYPEYRERFAGMLNVYQEAPWFLWDKTPSSYPEVIEEYASFDLLLHPSGAEVASQVAIECLGLRKPVLLLDCSTNPSLFHGLATFIPTTGEIRPGSLPFYIPNLNDLCRILRSEIQLPDVSRVEERFHERILTERIPLLFEKNPDTIKSLYAYDRKCYSTPCSSRFTRA